MSNEIMNASLETLYQGSVKTIRGPFQFGSDRALLFEFTDSYSVFDWGKMPDAISTKGQALAVMSAFWFETLASSEAWRAYSKSADALLLRKENRFGSAFVEVGERLKTQGLRTHYLGAVEVDREQKGHVHSLADLKSPTHRIACRAVHVERPGSATILGREVYDYAKGRGAVSANRLEEPRLVPLEVVFRFAAGRGSSLRKRLDENPNLLDELGFQGFSTEPGALFGFPFLEVYTKLESTDRLLSFNEALAISGLSTSRFTEMLFLTAWVAGFVRAVYAREGITLEDGKLEWAIDRDGELMLVDAIGPDELRLTFDGISLSKELLREHYRGSAWHEAVLSAKAEAAKRGEQDWKKRVGSVQPEPLSAERKSQVVLLYQSLCNATTGKKWFKDAPSIRGWAADYGRKAHS